MAHLITDYRGKRIRWHSYSAGRDFDFCPRMYKLARKDGWAEREQRVAMEFGKCIEEAVKRQCLDGHGGEQVFAAEWAKHKERTDLTYKEGEKDWATCDRMGRELMQLFPFVLPSLPIAEPKFQLQIKRELFPKTELAGIEYLAYLDCVSSPAPEHQMLAAAPADGRKFRPLVIDIKASGRELAVDSPQMLALDDQLRAYAWISGVRDVAFLYFVKGGVHDEFKRGDEVTLFASGAPRGVIGDIESGVLWILSDEKIYQGLKEYTEGLKGKALETKRREFVESNGQPICPEDVTRQRIQFLSARLDDENVAEIEKRVACQVAGIVNCERTGHWPRAGGIRFPNAKCTFCYLRGICAGDAKLAEELATRKDAQWLDEIGEAD